nr:putative mfs-type transporter [Quercus suber]
MRGHCKVKMSTIEPAWHGQQTPREETESPLDDEQEKDVTRPSDMQRSRSAASLRKIPSLQQAVSLPREIVVIALICLAQFMTQVALGQVLAILHVIGDDFGITEPGILSWLIAGYSLTVGTFILLSGRLGDIYGYKRMLVIGYSWDGPLDVFTQWTRFAGSIIRTWEQEKHGVLRIWCLRTRRFNHGCDIRWAIRLGVVAL